MQFFVILTTSIAIAKGSSHSRLFGIKGGFRGEHPTSYLTSSISTPDTENEVDRSSRNLKKIIQELEESDYGSFGSYGNFKKQRKDLNDHSDESSEYQVVNIGSRGENQGNEPNQLAVYYEQNNVNPIAISMEALRHSPQIINLSSTFKLIMISVLGGCLSYISIVPRDAFVEDYNRMFKETLLRLVLSSIWPLFLMWLLFGSKHANVNQVVDSFVKSFFQLYPVVCGVEFIFATICRVISLNTFEPGVFNLFPDTPGIILPWTLPQHGYLPKRVTMYIFSFINGCGIGPIIEESFKLGMLSHIIRVLDRNNKKAQQDVSKGGQKSNNAKGCTLPAKSSSDHRSSRLASTNIDTKSQSVPEANRGKKGPEVSTAFGERPHIWPITVRTQIIHMLAISLGLKVADNYRRILLYNAPSDRYKAFFAIGRGIFPVQELCGILTALGRAEEALTNGDSVHDKKGGNNDNMKRKKKKKKKRAFRALGPAILLHFMANFRGMKPLYVWASKNPWDEIQIQALGAPDHASAAELIAKCGLNLLWFMVLFRTTGYTMKKYVEVSKLFYLQLLEEGMN